MILNDLDRTTIPPARQVRHIKSNFIGSFASLKMGRMVNYESLLERDLIYLLDFESSVINFEEQPLSIQINSGGRRQSYTPDFHIVTPNSTSLIEVKPERFVDLPKNTIKLSFMLN